MGNGLFYSAKEIAATQGDLDPLAYPLMATLAWTDEYPLSRLADKTLSDIPPDARLATVQVHGVRVEHSESGTLVYCDDIYFPPVGEPRQHAVIVIWQDTGDESTSPLWSIAGQLELNGGDVTLALTGEPLYDFTDQLDKTLHIWKNAVELYLNREAYLDNLRAEREK